MRPSEGFKPQSIVDIELKEEQMAKIIEEGLPPILSNLVHFYINIKYEEELQKDDLFQKDPLVRKNIPTFLRLPQEVVIKTKPRCEFLVDNSQSQIFDFRFSY